MAPSPHPLSCPNKHYSRYGPTCAPPNLSKTRLLLWLVLFCKRYSSGFTRRLLNWTYLSIEKRHYIEFPYRLSQNVLTRRHKSNSLERLMQFYPNPEGLVSNTQFCVWVCCCKYHRPSGVRKCILLVWKLCFLNGWLDGLSQYRDYIRSGTGFARVSFMFSVQ